MVLADSNVWLALALSTHQFHELARDWLARQAEPNALAFCRLTQLSFLRLLTTRAVLAPYGTPPLRNKSAWSLYTRFRADQRIGFADEPKDVDRHWQKLTAGSQSYPKLWMDAYLAAFALAQPCRLVTTDKAFRQFKGLDLVVL
ncbi:MAG: TA system VapC family ribonuclease toxin [Gemmataceae bacterium]